MGLLSLDCRGGGKQKRTALGAFTFWNSQGRDQDRGRLWMLQTLLAEDKGESEENRHS